MSRRGRSLSLGDTPYDVPAAKKIELPTIGLLCGGFAQDDLYNSGAIAIFCDPADLLERYLRSPLGGEGNAIREQLLRVQLRQRTLTAKNDSAAERIFLSA